jgi:hypothetical protein
VVHAGRPSPPASLYMPRPIILTTFVAPSDFSHELVIADPTSLVTPIFREVGAVSG